MATKYIREIKYALFDVTDSLIANIITFFMYHHYYIHMIKKFFIIFSFITE